MPKPCRIHLRKFEPFFRGPNKPIEMTACGSLIEAGNKLQLTDDPLKMNCNFCRGELRSRKKRPPAGAFISTQTSSLVKAEPHDPERPLTGVNAIVIMEPGVI